MNRQVIAILKNIIRDISKPDQKIVFSVRRTINDPTIISLLFAAGCPESLLRAMQETIDLSLVERKYCCRTMEKYLTDYVKNPRTKEYGGYLPLHHDEMAT